MALWGTTDDLAAKPKIFGRSLLATGITNDPRTDVYATTEGWVRKLSWQGQPEVLVAIRGLSTRTGVTSGFAAAGLAEASITSMNWNITTLGATTGGTLSVSANFNETITVTGVPKLVVQNDAQGGIGPGQHHLLYVAASSTPNRLTFELELEGLGEGYGAVDNITVGANAIAQVSGSTIKDTVSTNNAVILNSAAIGTAAGTIVVTEA